jgi:hypothetical protein
MQNPYERCGVPRTAALVFDPLTAELDQGQKPKAEQPCRMQVKTFMAASLRGTLASTKMRGHQRHEGDHQQQNQHQFHPLHNQSPEKAPDLTRPQTRGAAAPLGLGPATRCRDPINHDPRSPENMG